MFDLSSGMRRAVAAFVMVCLVTATAPGFAAEKPYGAATPQELVERMKGAAEAEDFGEMMACMSPEDRKAFGGMMLMMGVMMVGFSQMAVDMGTEMAEGMAEGMTGEELTAEQRAEMDAGKAEAAAAAEEMTAKLRAVLEPHGLAGMLAEDYEPGSAEDQAMDEALENADMIALTESMMELLAELKEADDGEGSGPDEDMKPDWFDDEVTDYRVEGDTATAQAGDETLEMVRIDGRWYFAPQMAMEEGEMDEMMPEAEPEPDGR